ncbi:hypothetical protein EXIGLDRAFT_837104 [Exidia glandulosa HHB12029]|uniref:F-box domain-containing protein n=1 Tax=Exidia glandulosa HHB12029 TaxID=1314781 RepID=A0A165H4K6_EXIGL|nr:hypothetical protein EXIGLDRAFT_837104 [Exidia glandulosa HHB12029]
MSLGDPSTWIPNVSPAQLESERLHYAGVLIGAVAYGVHATLFFVTLSHLWPRRAQDWKWIVYSTIVFAAASIGNGGGMRFSEMTYVDNRVYPGGPAAYVVKQGSVLPNAASQTAYILGCWLQDGLLLYRVWIIFDRSWAATVIPAIVYLGLVGESFTLILLITTLKQTIYVNLTRHMIIAHFSVAISFGIIVTGAIVGRLLRMRGRMSKTSAIPANTHVSVAALLIESAALYSVVGTIFLVSLALQSPVQDLILPAFGQIPGIAPLLIILRVAQGRAMTHTLCARKSFSNQLALLLFALLLFALLTVRPKAKELEDELRLSMRSVFDDIRQELTSRSRHARLPSELLAHIWRLLSLVDRVGVSQVCVSWRTAALASASLWTEVDVGYCVLHQEFPACVRCHCHIEGVAPPNSNLDLLPLVLPRSKNLPLSLRFRSTQSMRPRLMDFLAEDLHRLALVHIDAVHGEEALNLVLPPFCKLQSLRVLRLNTRDNLQVVNHLWPDDFDVRSLEYLYIACASDPVRPQGPLPNLTTLHFSFTMLEEILSYLNAAPQLSDLSLDAIAVDKYDVDDWTRTQCHAIRQSLSSRRLSKISVIGIQSFMKPWILDMFHVESCPDLSLAYIDSEVHNPSLTIFGDIIGPASISLLHNRNTSVTARARGEGGRIRQISGYFRFVTTLPTSISAYLPVVRTLTIDYRDAFAFWVPVRWCSTVESLAVDMRRSSSLSDHEDISFPLTLMDDLRSLAQWSRLAVVTLGVPDDGLFTVATPILRDVVRFITADGDLEKLVLRGVYTDAETELVGLARTLVCNGAVIHSAT